MWRFCSLSNARKWYKLNIQNSNTTIQCHVLTTLSVRYCKIRYDPENFHTNRHWRIKLSELAFSLHSLSVTFVTSTCFLSLSNCVTALAANSVSLKVLIFGYVSLYNFKQGSALRFRRHHKAVCVLFYTWKCSGSFFVITVSRDQLQTSSL